LEQGSRFQWYQQSARRARAWRDEIGTVEARRRMADVSVRVWGGGRRCGSGFLFAGTQWRNTQGRCRTPFHHGFPSFWPCAPASRFRIATGRDPAQSAFSTTLHDGGARGALGVGAGARRQGRTRARFSWARGALRGVTFTGPAARGGFPGAGPVAAYMQKPCSVTSRAGTAEEEGVCFTLADLPGHTDHPGPRPNSDSWVFRVSEQPGRLAHGQLGASRAARAIAACCLAPETRARGPRTSRGLAWIGTYEALLRSNDCWPLTAHVRDGLPE